MIECMYVCKSVRFGSDNNDQYVVNVRKEKKGLVMARNFSAKRINNTVYKLSYIFLSSTIKKSKSDYMRSK